MSGNLNQVDTNSEVCANCGAMLNGAYCSRCGQRAFTLNVSYGDLLGEYLRSVFSLDSGIARTLLNCLLLDALLFTSIWLCAGSMDKVRA